MPDKKDYTFQLLPGLKKRYNAGQYNVETRKPKYEIKINAPEHTRDQIVVNQVLIGDPNDCQLVWIVDNESSWPAFVIIKKDGVKI